MKAWRQEVIGMTRRERVIQALKHKSTDIIPYNITFTIPQKQKMAEYFGDPDFIDKIGNHIDTVYYSGFINEAESEMKDKPGYFVDDFGVIWNRSGIDKDIGVIDNLVLPEPDLKNFRLPEIDFNVLRRQYQQLADSERDTFKMVDIGFTMFERAWTLRGMENFLTDMLIEPSFAHELLDEICEFNMRIINVALEYDIDAIHFGDDWGQQRGLIMGPRLWREFIKPRMKRMFEAVKSKGKFVSLHSCGDIHELFPDLIEIGLDVYQTFQPEIYDIREFKREYGKDLAVWGGISTQQLLPYATPEEVRRVTIETMKILGENGGYIAAPTHDVPGDVPPENIEVLIDVFKNQ